MNPVIKRELEKVRYPLQYDDDTVALVIPKKEDLFVPTQTTFKSGDCYLVKLSAAVLNNTDNATLASNWNRGVVPKSQLMNISVNSVNGTMINVDAVGVQPDGVTVNGEVHVGLWLPTNSIQVIQAL